ncbi:MAG: hypothetical protein ABIP75_00465 [Pyrinomonadaceae bacterium]
MKKFVFLMGLAALCFGVAAGQTQQRTRIAGNTDINGSIQAGSLAAGTQISGQLESTLDVKKLKPGDQVVLKTKDAVRSNGQVIAKKGSRLVGHVTDVGRRARGKGESSIGIVFDRLENGSMQLPLNASITSVISTSTRATANEGALDAELGMGSTTGTMVGGGRTGGGGGGLLGGVTGTVGGITNTTTNTVGGVVSTTGGVVNATGQTVGSTTGAAGTTVNGLRISPIASGSLEGGSTLSVRNDNLRLEKGTTFLLRTN